ncbi:MAG: hypothetical protein HYZ14_09260 [Bacteroidetes bacterium]|nr:hypothetical protein [Bacteroidota bacterium]
MRLFISTLSLLILYTTHTTAGSNRLEQKNKDLFIVPDTNTNQRNFAGWEILENEVHNCMDSITNSTSENRKKLLYKFISYSEKVDGALAESYAFFAFDYVNNHSLDFFSCLNHDDKKFIDSWAQIAAQEVSLGFSDANTPKNYLKELGIDFRSKTATLTGNKLDLADLYLKKLMAYSSKS